MLNVDLDKFLVQTIADRKLSQSEKNNLNKLIAEHVKDEQGMGFLRHRIFAIAKTQITDKIALEVLDWLENVLKLARPAGGTAPVTDGAGKSSSAHFSPGDDCLRQIVHQFQSAKAKADVCVFTITDDRIANAMLAAHRRGVKIRVISDDDKALDPGSDIDKFRNAGMQVRLDDSPAHMHHKFAIFDGATVLSGSYNWTRGAAENNQENIVLTCEPALVRAFTQEFEKLWSKFS